jgi:hypothetical protein
VRYTAPKPTEGGDLFVSSRASTWAFNMAAVLLLISVQILTCQLGEPPPPNQSSEAVEFINKITQLQFSRARDADAQEKLEKQGQEMLAKYTDPDKQALIHYSLCHAHAQSGVIRPELIIEHGTAALPNLKDEFLRMRTYVYVGDAQQIMYTRLKDFPHGRTLAAAVYLAGLRELLHSHDSPMNAPTPHDSNISWPNPSDTNFDERTRAFNKYFGGNTKERKPREWILHRDVLEHQLTDLYQRAPAAFDEFQKLGVKAGLTQAVLDDLVDQSTKAYKKSQPAMLAEGGKPVADAILNDKVVGLRFRPLLVLNALIVLVLLSVITIQWHRRLLRYPKEKA